MNFLLDNLEIRGNSISDLAKILKEMSLKTHYQLVDCENISVCYIPSKIIVKDKDGKLMEKEINKKEDIKKTKSIRINVFKPNEKETFNYTESGHILVKNARLNIESIIKNTDCDAFLDELLSTRTIFCINGAYCLVSDVLDMTLYQRIDMSGRGITEHSMIRNAHIAELLNNAGKATAIIRTQDGIHKLFSLMSSKFTYISQTLILDIINSVDPKKTMGTPICHRWTVTNVGTNVFIEFPEKADEIKKTYKMKDEFIPGIMISKSDIGLGSIEISGTWRHDKSICIFETISKKHSGSFDTYEFVEKAVTKIFGEYTKLPERLCELMMEDITDDEWFKTMSSKQASQKNIAECMGVLKNVFKQVEMTKAIQKKREKIILEELNKNLDPEMHYTAYDICMMIMELPGRVTGLSRIYETALMNAIGMAPYAKYKKEKTASIKIA